MFSKKSEAEKEAERKEAQQKLFESVLKVNLSQGFRIESREDTMATLVDVKGKRIALEIDEGGRVKRRKLPDADHSRAAEIDEQWLKAAPSPWGLGMNSGERKMLYTLLDQDETLERLVGGDFGPDLGQAKPGKTFHHGIGAATDRRVIFVDKGVLGSTEVAELPYASIEAITHSKGMFRGGIRITGKGALSLRIENVAHEDVLPFVNCVREHLQALKSGAATGDAQASEADEIEKLAALMEKGYLTKEEFEAKKKQLLNLP